MYSHRIFSFFPNITRHNVNVQAYLRTLIATWNTKHYNELTNLSAFIHTLYYTVRVNKYMYQLSIIYTHTHIIV